MDRVCSAVCFAVWLHRCFLMHYPVVCTTNSPPQPILPRNFEQSLT